MYGCCRKHDPVPVEVSVTTWRAVWPSVSVPKSTRAGDAPSVHSGCGPGSAMPFPVSRTCRAAHTGQSRTTELVAGPAADGANDTVTVALSFGSRFPINPCGETSKSVPSSAGCASTLSATGESLVTVNVSVFCDPTLTSPKSSRSGAAVSRGW